MANQFATKEGTDSYLNSLVDRRKGADSDTLKKLTNEYQRVYNATYGKEGAGYGGGAAVYNTGGSFYTPGSAGGSQKYSAGSFDSPDMNTMSYENAMKIAQQKLNPLYQQSRENAGAVNAQQQQLLSQKLNARGQLNGGLAVKGALDTSQALQQALATIDTQYNTQTNDLATQLQSAQAEQQQQAFNNALNAWQANNSAQMQAAQFNYGMGRDAVADSQWQAGFDENVRQYGLNYALQKAQADWERAYGEAGLTGYYNGNPTMDKVNADRSYGLSVQRASGGGSGWSGGSGSSGGTVAKTGQTPAQQRSSFNSYIAKMNGILEDYTKGKEANSYNNTGDYTAGSGNLTGSSSSMQKLINDIYSDPYVDDSVKENILAQVFNNQMATYLLGLNPGHSR